jgi:hypothetical protein
MKLAKSRRGGAPSLRSKGGAGIDIQNCDELRTVSRHFNSCEPTIICGRTIASRFNDQLGRSGRPTAGFVRGRTTDCFLSPDQGNNQRNPNRPTLERPRGIGHPQNQHQRLGHPPCFRRRVSRCNRWVSDCSSSASLERATVSSSRFRSGCDSAAS